LTFISLRTSISVPGFLVKAKTSTDSNKRGNKVEKGKILGKVLF